jgi:4-amino-4-deoxychorismate lyase
LRIVYDLNRNYKTQLIPYAVAEIDSFQLVENNTYDYAFKFEDRKEFERMKTKAKQKKLSL